MSKPILLNPEQPLRLPPSQGGVKRVLPNKELQKFSQATAMQKRRLQQNLIQKKLKKTLLKKALPYLLMGGSTGVGLSVGLSDLLL